MARRSRTPPSRSEDMETLKHTDRITDYGEFNIFPIFSGKPLA